jgi:hypothetical protein
MQLQDEEDADYTPPDWLHDWMRFVEELHNMFGDPNAQHGNNTIPGWYTHGIWLFHDDYPTYIMALYTVVDILNAFY